MENFFFGLVLLQNATLECFGKRILKIEIAIYTLFKSENQIGPRNGHQNEGDGTRYPFEILPRYRKIIAKLRSKTTALD